MKIKSIFLIAKTNLWYIHNYFYYLFKTKYRNNYSKIDYLKRWKTVKNNPSHYRSRAKQNYLIRI